MGKHEDISSSSIDIFSESAKQQKKNKRRKKKKKMSVGKKIVIVLLCFIIALSSALVGTIIWTKIEHGKVYVDIDEENLDVNSEETDERIINIALFGIDTRKGESMKGLSDTIMVMSVNKKAGTIKLVSIMRDSEVNVDGRKNKINSAYAKGGPELAIRTLNNNFGLDITDYATVNFGGMAEVIDAVGGVECNVTQREIDNKLYGINYLIGEQSEILGITPQYVYGVGPQTLNGVQATAWARIRHEPTAEGVYDDYGRTARQRHVLTELFNKAKSMNVLKYPNLIKKLLPYVETSLSYTEIIKLAPAIKSSTLTNARIPHDGCVIPGGGVNYNLEYAAAMLRAYLYEDTPFEQFVQINPIMLNPSKIGE